MLSHRTSGFGPEVNCENRPYTNRLTNAFSKKFENHMHMVALYTVWYNFVKQHKSLKGVSPAMASGISDTLWSMTDLAEMVNAAQPKPSKRGPYRRNPS